MTMPITSWWRRFRGIGSASPAIPPLDGPYDTNNALEDAAVLARLAGPDNLVMLGGVLHVTSGSRLLALGPGGACDEVMDLGSPVTAAIGLPDGGAIVALAGGKLVRVGPQPVDARDLTDLGHDVTALAVDGAGALFACIGSTANSVMGWTRDLLEKRTLGSVWQIDPIDGGKRMLADGLAYPAGVIAAGDRGLVVSEAWRNQLIAIDFAGATRVIAGDLPGYPARLSPAAGGGAWLAMMAPRNQLLEFVLREDTYRSRMLAEIDPAHWIAPALTRSQSYLEPMQQGAQRSLGILKPWAPGFSIGMVVRFDADWTPQFSLLSRADGTMHGVRSVIESGDSLIVASTGGNGVLSLPLDRMEEVSS